MEYEAFGEEILKAASDDMKRVLDVSKCRDQNRSVPLRILKGTQRKVLSTGSPKGEGI